MWPAKRRSRAENSKPAAARSDGMAARYETSAIWLVLSGLSGDNSRLRLHAVGDPAQLTRRSPWQLRFASAKETDSGGLKR